MHHLSKHIPIPVEAIRDRTGDPDRVTEIALTGTGHAHVLVGPMCW